LWLGRKIMGIMLHWERMRTQTKRLREIS
jgi:hypothetical protein